ncbi:hypothetical protein EDC04DRAFT_2612454 [Pisolithus marmoratus]|nr:hypothetical protein EDC04DRAFT_2612454 [Pisolithus marmoratus]
MAKTSLPPSTSTPINPMDVINQVTERILEHLAMIQVVKDTKVWWDCYEAIWEQLNYVHAIKHSLPQGHPEELVGHWWAYLGGGPIPQDLEVPERGKPQSGDLPEGLWDVGQSVGKGKGKDIALSTNQCNSHLGMFTFTVKATYPWVVPLELLLSHTICWPSHISSQYIHGLPTHQPTNLMKKEVMQP